MADKRKRTEREPSKTQLQRQMARTRESLAETVGEIKETVEQEVAAVKSTVSGVLDFREEFQKEPLLLSLGALSAGFALGYTVGYAHKNTKGGKQTPVLAFANSMVGDISSMGQGLVLPALDAKIKEMFGLDFSKVLQQLSESKKPAPKKTKAPRRLKAAAAGARAAKAKSSAKSKKK